MTFQKGNLYNIKVLGSNVSFLIHNFKRNIKFERNLVFLIDMQCNINSPGVIRSDRYEVNKPQINHEKRVG